MILIPFDIFNEDFAKVLWEQSTYEDRIEIRAHLAIWNDIDAIKVRIKDRLEEQLNEIT